MHMLTIGMQRYDTIGLFGRSLRELTFMAEHSLSTSPPSSHDSLPTRILYPTDFFPLPNAEHQILFENFIENLEKYLGVKRVEVNLAQLWADKSRPTPNAAGLPSLQHYMKKVSILFPAAAFLRHVVHRQSSNGLQGPFLVALLCNSSKIEGLQARLPRKVWPRALP